MLTCAVHGSCGHGRGHVLPHQKPDQWKGEDRIGAGMFEARFECS